LVVSVSWRLVVVDVGRVPRVAGMQMVAVDADEVLWWSCFLVFPPSKLVVWASIVAAVSGG
jgi:hypothetical protein